MTDSRVSTSNTATTIPIEIITEEEMAIIEAALLDATEMNIFNRSARSMRSSVDFFSKRTLSACKGSRTTDIEDSGRIGGSSRPDEKENGVSTSFLNRFRRKCGLSVTDITRTEWCEKQMEFILQFGKPESTEAMKVGSARHLALEKEVIKRVKVNVESVEDVWGLKFMNFIIGANQLVFDGLTRELPIVGFVEGVWMVGIIDEIRMCNFKSERCPVLIDTKTRVQATPPGEPQRRNGRLQLMCYKRLWDSVVADRFPSQEFFDFFSLNPNQILSLDIRESTIESGFPSETLNDLLRYFENTCSLLPRAHDQLLLRYELQKDLSFLGEDQFDYELDWVNSQITSCLEFWNGEREANYAPIEERYKCRFCKFSSKCQVNSSQDVSPVEGQYSQDHFEAIRSN